MKTQETNGLEVYEYEGSRFNMLVQYGTWGVAMSGGSPEYRPIRRMTRHMMTDEVFVLLKGSCTLFTAGQAEKPGPMDITELEPYKIYNVTKTTWHSRRVSEDGLILVVENNPSVEGVTEAADLDQEY
ncbi:MAG: hypothetical protein IJL53_08310 [Firmicutes bacterium]|nr:hypothetical protein [Bacillota bacterium]